MRIFILNLFPDALQGIWWPGTNTRHFTATYHNNISINNGLHWI